MSIEKEIEIFCLGCGAKISLIRGWMCCSCVEKNILKNTAELKKFYKIKGE